ncbi:MAG TPA: XdhC family protein [Candidatus Tumulicola sp.]
MRAVFARALAWQRSRVPFAIATLVGRRDAAAAEIGTSMAIALDGSIVGNVGAGCYESDIVEAARATAVDGRVRDLTIDLSGDDLLTGSSGCGGSLDISVWKPDEAFASFAQRAAEGRDDADFDVPDGRNGSRGVFHLRVSKRRTIVVVGATALANELAEFARRLDFRTLAIDPRAAFATSDRLPAVDEIMVAWPDDVLPILLGETTPLVVLSHDPKIDLPALRCGLRSSAPYVGLLGSRRAQRSRRDALQEDGFDEADIARIYGPAGLDLGGVTIAETALSIVAEIVATARGGGGGTLAASHHPIHRREPELAKRI